MNSTITGNTAYYGGGINTNGTVTITNSTIAGNKATGTGGLRSAGVTTLFNTIIVANTGDDIYTEAVL